MILIVGLVLMTQYFGFKHVNESKRQIYNRIEIKNNKNSRVKTLSIVFELLIHPQLADG